MEALSVETVSYIIVKAREFDAKVDPVEENPASDEADDGERIILEDFVDDPTYQELRDAIEDLDDDASLELVALMWIGRGTYDAEDWEEAIETARLEATNSTADYLTGTPQLGDFLEEGLAAMGYEVDPDVLKHL
ncbi:DUF3775 domain-containing protein [Iodidimonas sp. SYSU 1G8]|uniref:DUF3775 domain-containing protein n=1 Tax=Iodidimonas sp. SYSU 1G8 TaxID=3133967 RepID=UPI0031FEE673